MTPSELKAALIAQARALGFDDCRIAPAQPAAHRALFEQWLAEGKHGDMAWLARNPERRTDPTQVLPGAKSIIILALNYYQGGSAYPQESSSSSLTPSAPPSPLGPRHSDAALPPPSPLAPKSSPSSSSSYSNSSSINPPPPAPLTPASPPASCQSSSDSSSPVGRLVPQPPPSVPPPHRPRPRPPTRTRPRSIHPRQPPHPRKSPSLLPIFLRLHLPSGREAGPPASAERPLLPIVLVLLLELVLDQSAPAIPQRPHPVLGAPASCRLRFRNPPRHTPTLRIPPFPTSQHPASDAHDPASSIQPPASSLQLPIPSGNLQFPVFSSQFSAPQPSAPPHPPRPPPESSIQPPASSIAPSTPQPPPTTANNRQQPQTPYRVARYAWNNDYHDLIDTKLRLLTDFLTAHGGTQRPYVDTGPVLERDFATLSGLGWGGKSTMQIHRHLGTWFFLADILTTLELPPDAPGPDRCGTCTRCIVACPTQAITAPRRLDARRCISYLTIESKGPIPHEFRRAIGDRIYGCDTCLDACPWNRHAQASHEATFQARQTIFAHTLRDFLSLTDETFRALFAKSPIKRIKRPAFLRNVCIALGNTGTPQDLHALELASQDEHPLIAEHAAWAIAEIRARAEADGQAVGNGLP
ncbi:tRNA epoxyqueuosine(34) reductase QueG [Prosthecobacter sp.]|uniref:tRNA epoxyqueuosine(34) reductase QueG n=1 Tax=Prosthecobacter sp. TaxID=1965333 RepID=UPI003783FB06